MTNYSKQLCTFHIEDLLLGVGVDQVQEVIRAQKITRVPLAPSEIRGFINLRGQIITAIDLRQILGLPPKVGEEPPMNVIVKDGDHALSLLVDSIGDVLEVETDMFELPPPTVASHTRGYLLGAYKLPDRLLLALDLHRAVHVTHDTNLNTPA